MSTREWEKVLWKTQPYPDNHIPERYFLESLRKNRESGRTPSGEFLIPLIYSKLQTLHLLAAGSCLMRHHSTPRDDVHLHRRFRKT